MKIQAVGLLIAFTQFFLNAPAAAQVDDLEVSPSGPWVLDLGDEYCALRRDFGSEDAGMLMEFRQYLPSDDFDLLVGSDDLATLEKTPRVSFLPYEVNELTDARFLRAPGGVEGFTARVSLRPVEEQDAEEWSERNVREAGVEALKIEDAFERPVILRTGALSGPMDAMRTCMDDLMRTRGIDPDASRGPLARAAKPIDQVRWTRIIIRNYPRSALMAGAEATLRVFLQIDPEGTVSNCTVQTNLDEEVFEESTCRNMRRHARFEPALDGQGNPTIGFWSTNVIFRLN